MAQFHARLLYLYVVIPALWALYCLQGQHRAWDSVSVDPIVLVQAVTHGSIVVVVVGNYILIVILQFSDQQICLPQLSLVAHKWIDT